MKDEEVDEALEKAAGKAPAVDAALVNRITDSVKGSLRPPQALAPARALTGGVALICAAVAVGAAAGMGFHGAEKLTVWARVLVFSTLAILAYLAAGKFVNRFIPGSRRKLGAGAFLTLVCGVLLGEFALLFRDYHTDRFVAAGIVCLLTGLALAVPAGLLSWSLLRRGFAVNPVAAGLMGGTLAGLCGVTTLELHCANLQALHVLVWHTAVIPAGAAAGALTGWALQSLGSRQE